MRSCASIPPNVENGNVYCFHSAPATKSCMSGVYPLFSTKIITRYVFPSPFAQNVTSFFEDRFAGAIICWPGENMAPPQAYGSAGEMVPVISSDFALPLAPEFTTFIADSDFPCARASVVTDQPAPNVVAGVPLSKSLTTPELAPA